MYVMLTPGVDYLVGRWKETHKWVEVVYIIIRIKTNAVIS